MFLVVFYLSEFVFSLLMSFLSLDLLALVMVAVFASFIHLSADFIHIAIVHACLVLHKMQLWILKLS